MAIDWHEFVRANVRSIISAAREAQLGGETICTLLDVDQARCGEVSVSVLELVAQTKLQGAVALTSAEGNRIACLPLRFDRLVEILDPHEDTSNLQSRIRTRGTVALWVVCLDGDQRICIDIHLAGAEHN